MRWGSLLILDHRTSFPHHFIIYSHFQFLGTFSYTVWFESHISPAKQTIPSSQMKTCQVFHDWRIVFTLTRDNPSSGPLHHFKLFPRAVHRPTENAPCYFLRQQRQIYQMNKVFLSQRLQNSSVKTSLFLQQPTLVVMKAL